ncbi:MAG: methyl-accepting chemotaxis protein [Nitrospirae bacterium]|nr:methyl-accepting chemotaxis protein [Nitrospirota bacterium]
MKKGISLSVKLYGAMVFLCVALVIVGIVSSIGLNYVAASFTKTMEVEGVQMEAGMEAQVQLGNAVQSFKNYLLRKNSKYIDSFREAVSNIKKEVETYEKLSDKESEKTVVREVKEHIAKYEKSIDLLIAARADSDDIAAIDKQIQGVDRPVGIALKKMDSIAMKTLEDNKKDTRTAIFRIHAVIISTTIIALVLGVLFTAMLIRKILKAILSLKETTERAACGDLTVDVQISSNDEIGELAHAFNTMLGSMRSIIGKIFEGIHLLTENTVELNSTMKTILRMVDEQTSKTEQISTSSMQMSQTVMDIAKNASDMAVSAANTLKVAGNGSSVVTKTVHEVQEISTTVLSLSDVINSLGERSKQIGEIISVIKDIADQTNLLALNAAIEAARAGEQGRGFAVVADEVRKLAERTSTSTTEISSMINSIQDETQNAIKSVQEGTIRVQSGVGLAEQANLSLNEIVETVKGLQSMVQQIATSTEEMSTVSGTISEDIGTVAGISSETSGNSHNVLASVDKLSGLSAELQKIAGQFNIGKQDAAPHGRYLT